MPIYPFPVLLTPRPLIHFTTEEITDCTNKAAKGANKAGKNLCSCFFISCFTVSVILSINTFESSNYFMVLIISFISSFEIDKVNSFSVLTAPFPLIFLWDLFITSEVKLFTNLGELSLAKGIAAFFSTFFLN